MNRLKYFMIAMPLFFGHIAITHGVEIEDFLADMDASARDFTQQLDEITIPDLEKAVDAEETAKELFRAMEQSVRTYLDKLGNESALKQVLNEYIQRLGEAKERNLNKFQDTGDPDYKENADEYEALELEAREIFSKILEERGESILLLDKIKAQQDKVIEKIILGKFKRANASLSKTLANLQQMRESLNTLYGETRSIGERGGISN